MSGLLTVGFFLMSVVFSLLTFGLWLRFGLQYFHVSRLHPFNQMIHRLTDPFMSPIAKILQIPQHRHQRYDWLCFAFLVLVEWIKYTLIGFLYFGHLSTWFYTAVYVLADIIIQPCNILFYAIIIRVIMSWANPSWHNPLAQLIQIITDPWLRQIKRVVPDLGGFDLSPFLMMLSLKIITLFVGASLPFQWL